MPQPDDDADMEAQIEAAARRPTPQSLEEVAPSAAAGEDGDADDSGPVAGINIFYSNADEGYIADIPDLAVCSAFGETLEEALREVEMAKSAWLEAAEAEGKPVPSPRYRSAIYQVA